MNREWIAYPLLPVGIAVLIWGGLPGFFLGLALVVASYLLARSGSRQRVEAEAGEGE